MHFAVITGRSLDSIAGLVEAGRLPQPDFMVGAVGTELVDLADSQNAHGKKFAAQVSSDWDLEAIYVLGEGPGIQRQARSPHDRTLQG